MNSEDQTKQISESTRNLAKAVLIWGFQTFDTVQNVSVQAQEFIQDLVEEARAEQTANQSKEQNENVEPQQKKPQSVTPEQNENVEPQQKKPQSVKKK